MNPTAPIPTESSIENPWVRRHLLLAWGGLVVFLLGGLTLEALHAFKAPLYVDLDHQTRRLMWRLAHAHGGLLSLIHFGAAGTVAWLSNRGIRPSTTASHGLTGALLTLPGGFFLAGWGAIDGDPGVWIALVPVGALLLLVGCGLLFRAVLRARPFTP